LEKEIRMHTKRPLLSKKKRTERGWLGGKKWGPPDRGNGAHRRGNRGVFGQWAEYVLQDARRGPGGGMRVRGTRRRTSGSAMGSYGHLSEVGGWWNPRDGSGEGGGIEIEAEFISDGKRGTLGEKGENACGGGGRGSPRGVENVREVVSG